MRGGWRPRGDLAAGTAEGLHGSETERVAVIRAVAEGRLKQVGSERQLGLTD